jgi:hypothetical protein
MCGSRLRITCDVRRKLLYLNCVLQERFWSDVDRKLARLSLAPDDEQHVREKLLEKVPRPRGWAEILAPYAKFARKRTRAPQI